MADAALIQVQRTGAAGILSLGKGSEPSDIVGVYVDYASLGIDRRTTPFRAAIKPGLANVPSFI